MGLDVLEGDSRDLRCVKSSLIGRSGAELTPAVGVPGRRVLEGVATGIKFVMTDVVIVIALELAEKAVVDLVHEVVLVVLMGFRQRVVEAPIQVLLVLAEGEVIKIALVGRVQIEPTSELRDRTPGHGYEGGERGQGQVEQDERGGKTPPPDGGSGLGRHGWGWMCRCVRRDIYGYIYVFFFFFFLVSRENM